MLRPAATLARALRPWIGPGLALGALGLALAQNAPPTGIPIYTCIDAQGRLLSSDRPIPECRDRLQRELGPSGTVRRILEPPPSPEERARQEALQRSQAEAAGRAADELRREQLLLMRYPYPASHQRAREAALQQVQASLQVAQQRLQHLDDEARRLQEEMEFYRKDPSRAPATLKRRLADNAHQRQLQLQYLDDLQRERTRIEERFDAELTTLRRLWAAAAAPPPAAAEPARPSR